jgi:outer membrane protein assembly factor BamB
MDATTGEEIWRERIPGRYCASPLYADGKIYIGNTEGLTFVLAASDEFQILAENQLDGQLMASPVPVDGTLLIRAGSNLYRVGK